MHFLLPQPGFISRQPPGPFSLLYHDSPIDTRILASLRFVITAISAILSPLQIPISGRLRVLADPYPWFSLCRTGFLAAILLVNAAAGEIGPEPQGVAMLETPVSKPETADPAREERTLRKEQLEAATRLYGTFPRGDAMFVLAAVYNEQGDFDLALQHWEETTRLDDSEIRLYDRAAAYAGMGEVLHAKGERGRAEAMLREALRLKPRQPETWLQLARVLYAQGKPDDCLRLLDEGKITSAPAQALRGQALQRLGRLEEAKRSYEDAVRLKPDLAEAFYGLSTICARTGDEAKASEYRAAFLKLKSEQQSAGREVRMGLNPLQTTKESCSQTHTQVGWVYESRGDVSLAEQIWRRACELDPHNTAARFHLVMLFQKSGRNREALLLAKEMITVEPNIYTHHITSGNLQTRLGDYPGAEESYRKALSLAGDRPEPGFALAQFLLQRNANLDEALRLAQKAVTLAPTAPHYFVLARSCAKLNRSQEALDAAAKACELAPGNAQFQAFRASLKSRP